MNTHSEQMLYAGTKNDNQRVKFEGEVYELVFPLSDIDRKQETAREVQKPKPWGEVVQEKIEEMKKRNLNTIECDIFFNLENGIKENPPRILFNNRWDGNPFPITISQPVSLTPDVQKAPFKFSLRVHCMIRKLSTRIV